MENVAADHPGYIGTMACICAVAVILNILVITVIGKVGGFRTSIEIFVTNLAVNDILQAGVVLPVHFKNISVRDKDFHGGNVNSKIPLVHLHTKVIPIFPPYIYM